MRAWTLLIAALAFASPRTTDSQMRADFTTVDTVAKARRLVAQGKLTPILMFPSEVGGQDDPENRSFTTPEAAEARTLLIGTLRRMIREGSIEQMTVDADYRGDSIVPSQIRFKAWRSKKKGSFEPTIVVW